jgi:hypothetical protein
MRKGKSKGNPKLAVRVTFERSRLNADCLAEAYERLVPMARARVESNADLTETADRPQTAQRR